MWQFAAAVLLALVHRGSAFLPVAYALVSALSATALGGHVGKWVQSQDGPRRLPAVRLALVVQNVAVCVSALCVWRLLTIAEELSQGAAADEADPRLLGPASSGAGYLAAAGATLAGAVAQVASLASNLAVEKEWVIALSRGDDDRLGTMNATMRRIDLVCKAVTPAVVGVLVAIDAKLGAISVAVWNVASLFVEYWLLSRVHSRAIACQAAAACPESPAPAPRGDTATKAQDESPLHAYWTSAVCPSGLALAALYFNMLTFGHAHGAYLLWAGLTPATLGLGKALGAAAGVLATIVVPPLRRRLGTVPTGLAAACGLVGLWGACGVVIPSTLASSTGPWTVFGTVTHHDGVGVGNGTAAEVGGSDAGELLDPGPAATVPMGLLWIMVACTALSRLPLWGFDLAVTQMLQVGVEPSKRLLVNGAQASANSGAGMAALWVALIFSRPRGFVVIIVMSIACAVAAVVLHRLYWVRHGREPSWQAHVRLPITTPDEGGEGMDDDGSGASPIAGESGGVLQRADEADEVLHEALAATVAAGDGGFDAGVAFSANRLPGGGAVLGGGFEVAFDSTDEEDDGLVLVDSQAPAQA